MAVARTLSNGRSDRTSEHAGAAPVVLKHEARTGAWVVQSCLDFGSEIDASSVHNAAAPRAVVIKCRPLLSLSRRLKARLGLGHADRQWNGAAELLRIGVPTGVPLLSAWAKVNSVECELLVLEHVPGTPLLHALDAIARGESDLRIPQQRAIAQGAGQLIVDLLKGGVWNRDHKPSNVIVLDASAWKSPTVARLAVIDCVGIRPCTHPVFSPRRSTLARMLASQIIEPIGCRCLPRRALWFKALRLVALAEIELDRPRLDLRARMRQLAQEVRRIVHDHGDPRPMSDPLRP